VTDIKAVVDGIAAAIRTGMPGDPLAGRVFSFVPDGVNPPTAVVVPAPGDFLVYDDTFSGTGNFGCVVKILNGSQDSRTSQALLLGYMAKSGATSIRAAILASPTLGGICAYMDIPSAQNYGDVEWAGQQYLGFELPVTVFT
jgi:hypothetical protein